MEIKINNCKVDLNPNEITRIKPTFSFLHGRRFSLQIEGEKWIKNISLNDLILAVKTEAKKPGHDRNELESFFCVLKAMKNRGYSGKNNSIKKENFLSELITRIKHFFARIQRNKMLEELHQMIPQADHSSKVSFSEIDNFYDEKLRELNEGLEESTGFSTDSFNFGLLPEDAQVQVLRQLDSKSLLAFYQTNKNFKLLVETKLPKELKKARLEQQAFFKWETYLKNRIYFWSNTNFDYCDAQDEFNDLIERFIPTYSSEIIKDLNKLFLFSSDKNISEYRFRTLIKVVKALSRSHPEATIQVLKNAINTRLLKEKEIRSDKHDEVLECLKTLVKIDPASAIEYKDLLRSNMNEARNTHGNFLAYLEILVLIDPASLLAYENLLRFSVTDSEPFQSKKESFLINIANAATEFNLEQIFETIIPIQNTSLKHEALCVLMRTYQQQIEKVIPFIQRTIEMSRNLNQREKNEILASAATAYVRHGKLDEALTTIEQASHSFGKKFTSIEIAKAYAPINPEISLQILERLNPERLDDFYKIRIIGVYTLIDIEKAKELCNKIQNKEYKAEALFLIANVLKKKNFEAARILWDNILNEVVPMLDDVRQPYLSLLKIVRQMSEIDPNHAKQFLESHLKPLSRKELFEGMVKKKRVPTQGFGIYYMDNFKTMIEAYAGIDPIETEAWMKEFDDRIRDSIQASALMALKETPRA